MKRLLAALLAWALFAAPCAAAVSAPANLLGSPALPNGYENGVVAANIISTTQDAAVGALIIVPTAISSGAATISSVKDSVANCASAYSVGDTVQTASQRAAIYYCANTATDLAVPATATGSITTTTVTFTTNPGTLTVGQAITGSGVTAATQITGGISQWNGANASATVNNSQTVGSETLTVSNTVTTTFSTSGSKKAEMAMVVTGASSSPLDVVGHGTVTTTTSISTTITPSTATSSLLLACVWLTSGGTGDNYAADSAHNWLPASQTGWQAGSSTNLLLHCDYQVVSSTSAVTWSPAWTNNRSGSYVYASFKAPSGATSHLGLLLLGVGQ